MNLSIINCYFRKWILGIIFLWVTIVPGIQAENVILSQKIDNYLQPLLDEDLISGSVLIARGDQVLISKGFGLANREYQIPCTAHTRYRLASVSKQFTAAAILILQEKGNLSVNDHLSKYLPDFPNGDKITLHHLLNHTSGVVNYSRLKDHYRIWTMPHTLQQVIDRFKNEPLSFEPGSKWEYSNSGYVLLTAVIEKVSGLTYEEFIKQFIFDPLDMNESGVDSHTEVIPNRATGHYNHGEGIIQAPYLDIGFTSGAGSLYSSIGDLYKWHQALQGTEFLTENSKEQMFTPGLSDYGYGWFIRFNVGKTLIEHPGGINGFLTSIKYFIEDDIIIITLFNYVSTFARRVNQDLVSIALGEVVEPVLNPKGIYVNSDTLKKYTGTYQLQPDYQLKVEIVDGFLVVIPPNEKGTIGILQNKETFYLRKDNALVQFIREQNGMLAMRLFQSERIFTCIKTD